MLAVMTKHIQQAISNTTPHALFVKFTACYRGADKSLARLGRKQATVTKL